MRMKRLAPGDGLWIFLIAHDKLIIAGGEKMQDFRGDYCQRPLKHYGAFRERFMQNLSAWLVIHSFRGGDFGALPSINGLRDYLSFPGVEPLQNGDLIKGQKPYFAQGNPLIWRGMILSYFESISKVRSRSYLEDLEHFFKGIPNKPGKNPFFFGWVVAEVVRGPRCSVVITCHNWRLEPLIRYDGMIPKGRETILTNQVAPATKQFDPGKSANVAFLGWWVHVTVSKVIKVDLQLYKGMKRSRTESPGWLVFKITWGLQSYQMMDLGFWILEWVYA